MTRVEDLAPPQRAALATVAGVAALGVWAWLALIIALAGAHRGNAHPAANPAELWRLRATPQGRRWLAIGGLGAGLALAAPAAAIVSGRRRPLHGAARWASEAQIRREGLRDPKGVLLGRKGGRPLAFGGPEHVLLYAPTRSGKGVGVVIPNLLSWPGSAVVLDIKRENFDATAGFRAAHGQAVHLFDPLAPDGRTARYNPLSLIDRTRPDHVLDELQKIAVMLFPHEGARADPFWSEAARTGFIGVGALVAESRELPFTLGQIFRELTQGAPKQRLPLVIEERARAGRPLSAGCVSALTDFCAASDNTFASVRQTLTARMGLWLNPLVDAATSASDFDLRTLRRDPATLYLAASPDNLVRVAPLYNLLFQQLVDVSTRKRPGSDTQNAVLLVLDEFARLGHAGVLAHGFSFVAGYGLRILAVLQSPSQLRAEYGPDVAEEIIANCGVEIAFTPKELRVANDLSERIGSYTYASRALSRPAGLGAGRRSRTDSDQRRALMMPQELLQMPKDRLIVLRAGMAPVLGSKIVYYRDRAFTGRLLPPPPVDAVTDPQAQAGRIAAIAQELLSLRGAVEDIRARIVERPMTAAEAAGETPFDEGAISLALEDVDMSALPGAAASDAQIEAWLDDYAARAAGLPLDHSAAPPPGAASRDLPAPSGDRTP